MQWCAGQWGTRIHSCKWWGRDHEWDGVWPWTGMQTIITGNWDCSEWSILLVWEKRREKKVQGWGPTERMTFKNKSPGEQKKNPGPEQQCLTMMWAWILILVTSLMGEMHWEEWRWGKSQEWHTMVLEMQVCNIFMNQQWWWTGWGKNVGNSSVASVFGM